MRGHSILAAVMVLGAAATPALAGSCDDIPKELLQAIQATPEGGKAWSARDPISCQLRPLDADPRRVVFQFWSTTERSPTTCGFWWRYEADGRGGWRGPVSCS
jgi:hypothetical protein